MHFYKLLTTVASFALAASALPQPQDLSIGTTTTTSTASTTTSSTSSGGVQIVNNMNETVYLWSTSNGGSEMQTLEAGGNGYWESFATNSDGSGISIKMATTESEASVLQFEYTKDSSIVFWDLSCIDLDVDSVFVSSGFSVTTSDSTCSTASCAAGDSDCADAYQEASDDDTYSCSSSATFTLNLG